MDNFIDVLSRVMSRQEAQETYESGQELRANERERHQRYEEAYRRTRRIDEDWDRDIFFHGQGGLRIGL